MIRLTECLGEGLARWGAFIRVFMGLSRQKVNAVKTCSERNETENKLSIFR